MWAFTSETVLPTGVMIPQSHIDLLDAFFVVADEITPSPQASERFRNIFTADGVWKTPFATYSGHPELAQSGTLWTALRSRKSMRHWVSKVYASDSEGMDLMLLGRIRVEGLDGTVRDVNFSARTLLVSEDVPKIKFFQGWSSAQ